MKGKHALKRIDHALQNQGLFVSAISFWEVTMLKEKGRLDLTMEVELWRNILINNGLQEIALNGETGIQAALLRHFHGDPADRIIVATAIQTGATLCTADEKILAWENALPRIDARK